MPIAVAQMGKVFLAGTTTLSNHLFGAPHGLFRSVDDGKHWTRASLPDLDVLRLATNPKVPNVVIAFAGPDSNVGVGHGGIWASTNQGKTWKRINAARGNDAANGLILLPGHPFTVLFANTFNLWRSGDGGSTWKIVGRSIPNPLSLANMPAEGLNCLRGGGGRRLEHIEWRENMGPGLGRQRHPGSAGGLFESTLRLRRS